MVNSTYTWLICIFKDLGFEPGMVVHIYNPSNWEAQLEDHEFEASLGYLVRFHYKNQKIQVLVLNPVETKPVVMEYRTRELSAKNSKGAVLQNHFAVSRFQLALLTLWIGQFLLWGCPELCVVFSSMTGI
jgi:hypothetical protein